MGRVKRFQHARYPPRASRDYPNAVGHGRRARLGEVALPLRKKFGTTSTPAGGSTLTPGNTRRRGGREGGGSPEGPHGPPGQGAAVFTHRTVRAAPSSCGGRGAAARAPRHTLPPLFRRSILAAAASGHGPARRPPAEWLGAWTPVVAEQPMVTTAPPRRVLCAQRRWRQRGRPSSPTHSPRMVRLQRAHPPPPAPRRRRRQPPLVKSAAGADPVPSGRPREAAAREARSGGQETRRTRLERTSRARCSCQPNFRAVAGRGARALRRVPPPPPAPSAMPTGKSLWGHSRQSHRETHLATSAAAPQRPRAASPQRGTGPHSHRRQRRT